MATYASDEPSIAGAANEKEPTSVLTPDHSLEDGKVDPAHRAEDDLNRPSPRKVHGASVCRSPSPGAGHLILMAISVDTGGDWHSVVPSTVRS